MGPMSLSLLLQQKDRHVVDGPSKTPWSEENLQRLTLSLVAYKSANFTTYLQKEKKKDVAFLYPNGNDF